MKNYELIIITSVQNPKDIYKEYALKLVEMGKAYYCFCTEEELEEQRQ